MLGVHGMSLVSPDWLVLSTIGTSDKHCNDTNQHIYNARFVMYQALW